VCRYVPWYELSDYMRFGVVPIVGIIAIVLGLEPGRPGWLIVVGLIILGGVVLVGYAVARNTAAAAIRSSVTRPYTAWVMRSVWPCHAATTWAGTPAARIREILECRSFARVIGLRPTRSMTKRDVAWRGSGKREPCRVSR
jgi:hypothetical protein